MLQMVYEGRKGSETNSYKLKTLLFGAFRRGHSSPLRREHFPLWKVSSSMRHANRCEKFHLLDLQIEIISNLN